MRAWTSSIALLATLGLAAGTALAQGQVDLQLNLSTQPVYGGYRPPTSSYFNTGELYNTGNVRGGKALMINRNFLEDRFFSGSLTRFTRDTISASDVTMPGYSAGAVQPYFRPGSLTVSGSSVSTRPATGGLSPFGLSFNPAAALPSPFSVTTTLQQTERMPSRGEYPTSAAMRTFEAQTQLPEPTETSSPVRSWDQKAQEPAPSLLPQVPTAESLFGPKTPAEGATAEGLPATNAPQGLLPAAPQPAEQGLRPMDYLRQRFGAQAMWNQTPEAEGGTDLSLEPGREAVEPAIPLPDSGGAAGRERPRRFYEQYMAMGREELQAGAYRPAADAFSKAAAFSVLDPWQARYHEAIARLLSREYSAASYLLATTLAARPAEFAKPAAMTDLANRPDDWKAVEADLRQGLQGSPDSSDQAMCLAWMLILSGRRGEVEPLLGVIAKDGTYTDAVKVLREMLKP